MRYMLFICRSNEGAAKSGADLEAQDWMHEMDSRGIRKIGERLRPGSDATTVRVRGAEVLIGDGPSAETEGEIAGFDLIECGNLDEAIEVAAKHPVARTGLIEIRPCWGG